tara:strand:+ start:19 stop:921 length:903 start_codon:yes stop_codon:yes gene_type:complete
MCGGGSDDGSNDAVGSEEDPNTFGGDDPTGNTGGQTDQGISDASSVSSNNDSDEDTSDSFDANMGLSNQEVNQASANSLSQAAINSANTDQSQSPDSQSYFASTDVPNAMDFNFANSNAARDIRDNMDQGSVFRDPQNPVSSAINYLSKIGPQNTYNNLSAGYVPNYADGMITGTQNFGFGNDPNVPGYQPFESTSPSQINVNNVDPFASLDGDTNEIIRRRMSASDEEEFPIAPAPISDELASDYLQNPYYLYSGMGNQYQPYGYAQNTLVDLLRTRNMTQPQQRAANLGLFGNPGDFS